MDQPKTVKLPVWAGWCWALPACIVILTALSLPLRAQQEPSPLRPQPVLQLGHGSPPTALAFSPDGRLLASGAAPMSATSEIKIWNVESGEVVRTLNGHEGPVTLLQWSPDGNRLLSADGLLKRLGEGLASGQIKVWEMATGQLLRTIPPVPLESKEMQSVPATAPVVADPVAVTAETASPSVTAIAMSPDATTAARAEAVSAGAYEEHMLRVHGTLSDQAKQVNITLWDTRTGALLHRIEGGSHTIARLLFSPDGATLMGESAVGMQAWNVGSGSPRALPKELSGPQHLIGFAPDGKIWVRSEKNSTVRLADPGTAKVSRVLTNSGSNVDSTSSIKEIVGSPNLLISPTKQGVQLWDSATGQLRRTLPLPPVQLQSIAVSADGTTLALGGQRWGAREIRTREFIYEVHLYNVATGTVNRILRGRANPAQWVRFTADSDTLIGAWHDQAVRFWDLGTGQLKRTMATPLGVDKVTAVSTDGKWMARGSGFSNITFGVVTLWEIDTEQVLQTLRGHKSTIDALVFSKDGRLLATCDGLEAGVWEVPSGRPVYRFAGHGGSIMAVAFSPDNKLLATAGGGDGSVNLWEMESGELLGRLLNHNSTVYDVIFAPDSKTIVSLARDGMVRLWNVQTQEVVHKFSVGSRGQSTAIFSVDGQTLITGTANTIQSWNVGSGKLNGTLFTAPGAVLALAFSPDGKTLSSANGDGSLTFWNFAPQQLILTLQVLPARQDGAISTSWIALDPTGRYDGSANADDFLRWRIGTRLLPAATDAAQSHQPRLIREALSP